MDVDSLFGIACMRGRLSELQWSHVLMDVDRSAGNIRDLGGQGLQWSHVLMDVDRTWPIP